MITRTEQPNGYVKYTLNDTTHRPNGPALIYIYSNDWHWVSLGKFHRYYGPSNSYGGWWIHNEVIK
jgi:hypothetical protein